MHLVARSQSGLTLIEAMVAVTLLGIGLGALAGSSALVTRMIGRGAIESRAAEVAENRVEQLRAAAGSTTPRCTSPALTGGGPVSSRQVTERWDVVPLGMVRDVKVIVSYATPRGTHTDTLSSRVDC
jgi:prepilin-type N-terminal cleavage/methylation domain-containing protein